ncbi:MAG: hypothetical protein Q9182_005791 [Xanthomendoza sp. 2 TL-2023]
MAPTGKRGSGKSRPSPLKLSAPKTSNRASTNPIGPRTPTPMRPQRSLAVHATPSTSGPTPTDSPLPDAATDTSSRSCLRSGRPYLPKDTGIPPGRGRRLFSAKASSSGTSTPSQKSSRGAARSHPSPSPIQSSREERSSPLDSTHPNQSQENSSPDSTHHNQSQEYSSSSDSTHHNQSQENSSPDSTHHNQSQENSSPPDSTHYNQTPPNDHTLNQPFTLPPDYEQWPITHIGSPFPPQSSEPPIDTFTTLLTSTLDSRSIGSPTPAFIPATVPTTTYPPTARPTPRTPILISQTSLDPLIPEPNLITPAYHHFANNITHTNYTFHPSTPPPPCLAPDCPLAGTPHSQGPYIHNNLPAPNPIPSIFGASNPPPQIWHAIHRGTQGLGTQDDAALISGFIRHHDDGRARFSWVPDGNFAWGDEDVFACEGGDGGMMMMSPVVELPVRALPVRVRFDAVPNLVDTLLAGELGEEEGGDGGGWVAERVRGTVDPRVAFWDIE